MDGINKLRFRWQLKSLEKKEDESKQSETEGYMRYEQKDNIKVDSKVGLKASWRVKKNKWERKVDKDIQIIKEKEQREKEDRSKAEVMIERRS
jgi:hypothetical protein